MTKKIFISALLILSTIPGVAKAEPQLAPSVAILDTALDTSISVLRDRVIQEVCVLEYNSCPNGQSFMEGPGSAGLQPSFIDKNGFDHGTQMASVFASTNSSSNIVFVRIIGATKTGVRQAPSEKTFVSALDWVIANKDKYNIQAVSMSQGHHNLPNFVDYCPKTPSTQSRIRALLSAGIPTFLPTGNTRDYKRIDWPSCIDESISVGAVNQYEEIPIWSNMDTNKTDFYALGVMRVTGPKSVVTNAIGTSISAQVAAANWLSLKSAKPSYTYDQLYSAFKNTAVKVYNPTKLVGGMMYLQGANNG